MSNVPKPLSFRLGITPVPSVIVHLPPLARILVDDLPARMLFEVVPHLRVRLKRLPDLVHHNGSCRRRPHSPDRVNDRLSLTRTCRTGKALGLILTKTQDLFKVPAVQIHALSFVQHHSSPLCCANNFLTSSEVSRTLPCCKSLPWVSSVGGSKVSRAPSPWASSCIVW